MLLKECYDTFGGEYESVKQRISSDEIILKFVLKFLTEPSYANLCKALEEEDYEEAFRAAHSLKGVCQNLAFKRLSESSSVLTELLRSRDEKSVDKVRCEELLQEVSEDYKAVVEAIGKLKEA